MIGGARKDARMRTGGIGIRLGPRSAPGTRWLCFGAALILTTGCVGPRQDPAELVRTSDFARRSGDDVSVRGPMRGPDGRLREPRPAEAESAPVVYTTGPIAAREGIRDIGVRVGRPAEDGEEASAIGSAELIDAKVGDVNGRPIYASSFLAPLDAQIAAEARRDSPAEWTRNTYQRLQRQVFEVVRDELLKAEARESLTEEQQFGLRYFLQEQLNTQIRDRRGSRVAAERAIAETGEAQTLDEWIQLQEERTLVRLFLRRYIHDRVNVTRRDLELEYERLEEQFNPPPVARFRLIQIGASDTDAATEIASRLGRGEAFETVARIESNRYRPTEGGLVERTIDRDDPDMVYFNRERFENLDDAARAMIPGDIVGPIVDGEGARARVSWLTLEAIEDNARSFFEVQEALDASIRSRRVEEQGVAYVIRLMERASFTRIEDMADRLMDIVVERHNPRLSGRWKSLLR